jgi:hypothetical protein
MCSKAACNRRLGLIIEALHSKNEGCKPSLSIVCSYRQGLVASHRKASLERGKCPKI